MTSSAWQQSCLTSVAPVVLAVVVVALTGAPLVLAKARPHYHCIHNGVQDAMADSGVGLTTPQPYAGRDIAKNLGDVPPVRPPAREVASDPRAESSGAAWQPIRIKVDTSQLQNAETYCSTAGDVYEDFQGRRLLCEDMDVLTDEKRHVLRSVIIPLLVHRLQRLLSVRPVQGSLVVPSTTVCGRGLAAPVDHVRHGVTNSDIVVYATTGMIGMFDWKAKAESAAEMGSSGPRAPFSPSSPTTIAWAGYCSVDQHGRPVIAQVNFAPRYINWGSDAWDNERYLRACMHEMFHILGFTKETLVKHTTIALVRGKRAPVLRLSGVVQAARNHLGCPTLEAVEIEDEGGEGTAYSHWKRRQYRVEIMSGISESGAVSHLTLAFLASLGYYAVNARYAEPQQWAAGAGCDFVNSRCDAQSAFQGTYWCHDAAPTAMCTYDRKSIGTCLVETGYDLPWYYQYFTTDPTMGGAQPLMDYCPVVLQYHYQECTLEPARVSDFDQLSGSYFGPRSRCIPASRVIQRGHITEDESPRCLLTRCRNGGRRLEVQLGGMWIACPTDGSPASIPVPVRTGFTGVLHCEAAALVCTPELFHIDEDDSDGGDVKDAEENASTACAPSPTRGKLVQGAVDNAQFSRTNSVAYYTTIAVLLETNSSGSGGGDPRNECGEAPASLVSDALGSLLVSAQRAVASLSSLDIGAYGTSFTPVFAATAWPSGVIVAMQLAFKLLVVSESQVEATATRAPSVALEAAKPTHLCALEWVRRLRGSLRVPHSLNGTAARSPQRVGHLRGDHRAPLVVLRGAWCSHRYTRLDTRSNSKNMLEPIGTLHLDVAVIASSQLSKEMLEEALLVPDWQEAAESTRLDVATLLDITANCIGAVAMDVKVDATRPLPRGDPGGAPLVVSLDVSVALPSMHRELFVASQASQGELGDTPPSAGEETGAPGLEEPSHSSLLLYWQSRISSTLPCLNATGERHYKVGSAARACRAPHVTSMVHLTGFLRQRLSAVADSEGMQWWLSSIDPVLVLNMRQFEIRDLHGIAIHSCAAEGLPTCGPSTTRSPKGHSPLSARPALAHFYQYLHRTWNRGMAAPLLARLAALVVAGHALGMLVVWCCCGWQRHTAAHMCRRSRHRVSAYRTRRLALWRQAAPRPRRVIPQ